MKGYKIEFEIYAESEEEAMNGRNAIVGFIRELANNGRAVTGEKLSKALPRWKDNVLVRNKVLEYFS